MIQSGLKKKMDNKKQLLTMRIFIVFFIFWTEWGSLGSLLGVTGFSIIQMVIFIRRYAALPHSGYIIWLYMLILALNILTWCAHHANLARLFSGEERHTSIRKLAKKKKS